VKRFVVPPNWPMPPRRSWVPPKTWEPDPDWPPAPKGWKYWVNGKGKAVIGPVGRYGAPSVRTVVAGLGGAVLFVSVNLWALAAVGVFDGGSSKPQAAPVTSESPSGSVTATPTPPVSPQAGPVTPSPARTTEPSGPATPQTSTPVVEPTSRPTQTPTRSEQGRSPRPSTTVSTSPVPTPTTGTPTPEGLFAQYCHQLGDPKWCDPTSSSTPQPPGKSRKHH
jgi:hypothetical protein